MTINLDTNTKTNFATRTRTEFKIVSTRKRALSDQQIQTSESWSVSKRKWKDLEYGDNGMIPV